MTDSPNNRPTPPQTPSRPDAPTNPQSEPGIASIPTPPPPPTPTPPLPQLQTETKPSTPPPSTQANVSPLPQPTPPPSPNTTPSLTEASPPPNPTSSPNPTPDPSLGLPTPPPFANPSPTQPPQPPLPPQPQPTTPSPSLEPSPQLPPQENPTINSNPPPSSPKKKPILKIFLIVIVLLLLSAAGAAAYFLFFSDSTDTPSNPSNSTSLPSVSGVTLEYWGLWEPSMVLENVLSQFEDSHGVTVNYTQQSPQDYRQRLQSSFEQGNGPDLFRFHNTWATMLSNELDLLPSSVMTSSQFQNNFYPVAATDLAANDSFVGIPLMIDGLGLYYNKTIFATAAKAPPRTWDELRTTANELTIKTGPTIQRSGVALGSTEKIDHFSDILGLMIFQNGTTPATPNHPFAIDAIEYYTLFSQEDALWDETLPEATYAFATEKAAMMIAPSWRAHEVNSINPNLDFAIVPLPQLPDTQVTWASYWVEGVSKASSTKEKEAAWQLLAYLSSPEVLQQLYNAASQERLFGEPYPRPDMASQLLDDPYVGAYIKQAPDAVSFPMASRTFDNGINDLIIQYYQTAINDLNSGAQTDSTLETASQGVTQVLTRFGYTPQSDRQPTQPLAN